MSDKEDETASGVPQCIECAPLSFRVEGQALVTPTALTCKASLTFPSFAVQLNQENFLDLTLQNTTDKLVAFKVSRHLPGDNSHADTSTW